jgi:uncharacterized protein (UPF0264 family)
MTVDYAISLKQPWATLVAHGLKTIEIRRWSTSQRGRVLIHASRTPDTRHEGWASVPSGLTGFAQHQGGIVGEARLVECRAYASRPAFARDRHLHHNDPDWFQAPVMYGFVFAEARPLPFLPFPGSLYFFEVPGSTRLIPKTATGLLVSVRSAHEAMAALQGGADLIDIKEPRRGPLGRAAADVITEVVRGIAGRRPVSAALGELADAPSDRLPPGLAFVKCGLSKLGRVKRWQTRLDAFRGAINRWPRAPEVVTVAYADWKNAAAPHWSEVAKVALDDPGGVLLFDTFDKATTPGGRRSATLLDWLTRDDVHALCEQCHKAGVRIALAGSLRLRHLRHLQAARPTWLAVRGAVCAANQRDGEVHLLKVRDLAEWLRWLQRKPIPAN